MESVLALRAVSKQFDTHRAVDGVSFAVAPGELFALVGPSGCGKTTTLRLVAGFETPDEGAIELEGRRVEGLAPYERNVSTVFQNYALFPHLTVRENVEFGLRRRRARDARERAGAALEMVQLGAKAERRPGELSGGEKQRVALARSLVLEPAVLLLDEPLAALDPNLRKAMRGELKNLQRRTGVAFLFVTHDREEALSLSDRMAVMRGGHVEQMGTPEELYRRPATRFVAGFLGGMNWLDGVGVRPEAVRLRGERRGRVERAVFLGNAVEVGVRLETGEMLTASVPAAESPRVGETVGLGWRPEDEHRLPE
jgi:ABC-type Fe3+/spermidine/putrescine transport system ATPase subunit